MVSAWQDTLWQNKAPQTHYGKHLSIFESLYIPGIKNQGNADITGYHTGCRSDVNNKKSAFQLNVHSDADVCSS